MKFENLKGKKGTRVPFWRSIAPVFRGRVGPIVGWCWGVALQIFIPMAVAAVVTLVFRALIFWVLF